MFLLEAAPKDRRMLFASWQLASQNLSSVLGGSIGLMLALALSQSSLNAWGWRVPFAFGVLIAPVGITIRSQLVETLEKPPQDRARGATAILSAVIRSNWRGLLLGLALISGGTITQYFLITMTPYAIRTLHLPPSSAMLGAITLGITGCLGALAGGALADRWGLRPVVIAPRIVLMIVLFPVMKFLIANPSATTLVLAIAILSLLQAASVAIVVALTPLIFPPEIRATGLALTYALGVAIFGGTATYVVTWLVGVTGDPLASTYYVMAANAVLLLAALGDSKFRLHSRRLAAATGSRSLEAGAGRHARLAAAFGWVPAQKSRIQPILTGPRSSANST